MKCTLSSINVFINRLVVRCYSELVEELQPKLKIHWLGQARLNKLFNSGIGSNKKLFALVLSVLVIITKAIAQEEKHTKAEETIKLADPTVFYHDNTYYLYGTVEGAAGNGFKVYTSKDSKSWKLSTQDEGYALKKSEAYGTTGFWAPQVFFYNQKFYMAYVANENIAIAESSSPLGPFTQRVQAPLKASVKQIDPFVFIDDDGKKYLYHVRLMEGNRIFVAEMTDDFSSLKEETLRECITATAPWENTANAKWPVAEGPSIIKHKNLYYLFYTANDFRNPDYAVGYATSTSPFGPWKKYTGNPILSKNLVGINGTGHGDFFRVKKKLFYVFHTHNTANKVPPRRTALIRVQFKKSKGEDKLVMKKKSFRFLHTE